MAEITVALIAARVVPLPFRTPIAAHNSLLHGEEKKEKEKKVGCHTEDIDKKSCFVTL